MSRNLIYNQWIPYTQYEKHECDIKCKDGKIIYHVYPNAGVFVGCCGNKRYRVKEENVVEIMYRKYYTDQLCNDHLDGRLHCNKKKKIEYENCVICGCKGVKGFLNCYGHCIKCDQAH